MTDDNEFEGLDTWEAMMRENERRRANFEDMKAEALDALAAWRRCGQEMRKRGYFAHE